MKLCNWLEVIWYNLSTSEKEGMIGEEVKKHLRWRKKYNLRDVSKHILPILILSARNYNFEMIPTVKVMLPTFKPLYGSFKLF